MDDIIDEALVLDDAAVFERCFQHIDDFATEGLRTLLFGYRFVDDQEYVGWKKIYVDATTSLVDRQKLIENAGEMIEQNFDLAGATAIEDKLQKESPKPLISCGERTSKFGCLRVTNERLLSTLLIVLVSVRTTLK